MKNNKGIASIVIILIVVGVLAAGGYYFWSKNTQKQVACTMDAKICPDGSSVGRTGPNCEFAECPKEEYNHTARIEKIYQKNGKDYLDINFIKFIIGNPSIIYGENEEEGECVMGINGYCVVDNDKTIKSYEISESVEIIPALPLGSPNSPIPLKDLSGIIKDSSAFRLKIEGNVITEMLQIYIP